jgi:hypothetical protein
LKRDRVLILIILAFAVAATVFAGWFRWSQGHRALDFWGADLASQIRFAESIELLWLESPLVDAASSEDSSAIDAVTIDGVKWRVHHRRDITDARGLVHARQALIEDATYLWDNHAMGLESAWTHALVFHSVGKNDAVLLFDLFEHSAGYVREMGGTEKLQLTIPQGFETFFAEQD